MANATPDSVGVDMVYKYYSPAENKVLSFNKRGKEEEESAEVPDDDSKFVGSSHGWLALFNQRNNDLFLSNPITRRHIKLPLIHTLPDPEINLRDGRGSVSKVILSCSPDEDNEECRAMMTFGIGPADRLALCQPHSSTEWTPIGKLFFYNPDFHEMDYAVQFGRAYEDFVHCSGPKIFSCITQLGIDSRYWSPRVSTELEDWDLCDPRSPRARICDWMGAFKFHGEKCPWLKENMRLIKLCRQIPYLVFAEQYNQLFIVIRFVMERIGPDGSYVHVDNIPYDPVNDRLLIDIYPCKTIGFSVLKVDYGTGRGVDGLSVVAGLRLMEGGGNSLDGLAMFVGTNHSFAVPAAELGLKPNSIYFADSNKHRTGPDSIYGGHDIGIFDYENLTFSPCYYPSDVQSIKRIMPAPIWFTSSPH